MYQPAPPTREPTNPISLPTATAQGHRVLLLIIYSTSRSGALPTPHPPLRTYLANGANHGNERAASVPVGRAHGRVVGELGSIQCERRGLHHLERRIDAFLREQGQAGKGRQGREKGEGRKGVRRNNEIRNNAGTSSERQGGGGEEEMGRRERWKQSERDHARERRERQRGRAKGGRGQAARQEGEGERYLKSLRRVTAAFDEERRRGVAHACVEQHVTA